MHVVRGDRPRSQAACTCEDLNRWLSGGAARRGVVVSHRDPPTALERRQVRLRVLPSGPTRPSPTLANLAPSLIAAPSASLPREGVPVCVQDWFCCVVQKRSVSLACGTSATRARATSGLRRGQRRQRRARKGAEDRSRAPWPPCRRCCSAS